MNDIGDENILNVLHKFDFKVVFEDIGRSYYDNKTNVMHLRRDIIGNEKEIKKVLEHECPHYFLRSTWKNIIYEYNTVFRGILFLVLVFVFLYTIQRWSIYQQLTHCVGLYNNLTHSLPNQFLNISKILNST